MYGFNIIATCSPRHFDLVRSYGAKRVFDYRDEKVIENIKNAVPGLKYVFDTIGNSTSSTTASQAIHESGGTFCTVRADNTNTENVAKQAKVTNVFVWSAFLKDHHYGKLHWAVSTLRTTRSMITLLTNDSA